MHVIRLRGPWQVEPVCRFVPRADGGHDERSDELPPAVQATMPADWGAVLGRDFLGRVRYHRTFNSPTGLEAGDKVWLVVEPPRSRGTVQLSGDLLGDIKWGDPPARFEISKLVKLHNRVEVIVEHAVIDVPSGPAGLVGEVRLEIEPSR